MLSVLRDCQLARTADVGPAMLPPPLSGRRCAPICSPIGLGAYSTDFSAHRSVEKVAAWQQRYTPHPSGLLPVIWLEHRAFRTAPWPSLPAGCWLVQDRFCSDQSRADLHWPVRLDFHCAWMGRKDGKGFEKGTTLGLIPDQSFNSGSVLRGIKKTSCWIFRFIENILNTSLQIWMQ